MRITESAGISIKVASIGILAAGDLRRAKLWRVVAVYKHSIYCTDSGGNLLCLGSKQIGNGPFNLCCQTEEAWLQCRFSPGQILEVGDRGLILVNAGVRFDLSQADIWARTLNEAALPTEDIDADLAWLVQRAAENAPEESIGRLIPDIYSGNISVLRNGKKGLTEMMRDLVAGVIKELLDNYFGFPDESFDGAVDCLTRLIGVGPGLTPSGDDFLAGVIMALHKMQRQDDAISLARKLYRDSDNRTTAVSIAFYRALSSGYISEMQSCFLASFGTRNFLDYDRALLGLANLGGTSGWDLLAGFVAAYKVVGSEMEEAVVC